MIVEHDDERRRILEETRTIAVVGASATPGKPAHDIPSYLQDQGYRIIPVNPGHDEVLGEPAVDSLRGVEQDIDVVEVFRPSEETPDIARAAAEAGAAVLWLQEGIASDDAARIAEEAGLRVVMDTCMGQTHRRLCAS